MYNEYIKRPGQDMQYTDEQIQEVLKCRDDLIYFAKNYIKVVHPIDGIIRWEPRKYQLRILDAYMNERFTIVMAARQVGKTTASMIYLLWKAIFNDNLDIAILANKWAAAGDVMKRIKEAYEHLPRWLKPGVMQYPKQSIIFENGTRISAGGTTKDSIRGRSCSIVYLDEFAHVKAGVAREFWTSNYPTISTGGQCIIVSTPNGTGNLFYEIWKAAEQNKNQFKNVKVDWYEVPGRKGAAGEAWKKETIENLKSVILFNQEYGNKFIGSTNTLIDYKILENLVGRSPVETREEGAYLIWEYPIKDHKYVVSVDPSEGRGYDSHAIVVLDMTQKPWKQAARWKSNTLSLVDLPHKIKEIGDYYNEAYAVVESNGIGIGVLNDLFNSLEYPHIARMQKKPDLLGIRAHKGTKAEGCGLLKKVVENAWLVINDDDTINELLDFGPKGGKYQGLGGADDLVMSTVWALYFNQSIEFKSMAHDNYVEYFDFKKGIHVVDNTDVLPPAVMQDETSLKELVAIVSEANKTDAQKLKDWLIS